MSNLQILIKDNVKRYRMKSNNKVKDMTDLELAHLEAVRKAWKATYEGMKVCMVTVYECDWQTLLGNYYNSMKKYVDNGMIYHRVEESIRKDLQLRLEDLDNHIIEMDMV